MEEDTQDPVALPTFGGQHERELEGGEQNRPIVMRAREKALADAHAGDEEIFLSADG